MILSRGLWNLPGSERNAEGLMLARRVPRGDRLKFFAPSSTIDRRARYCLQLRFSNLLHELNDTS